MPKDTVRELRINLISVKDHSKYFFGGMWGQAAALVGKEVWVLDVPSGLWWVWNHVVMWAGGGGGGHPIPGLASLPQVLLGSPSPQAGFTGPQLQGGPRAAFSTLVSVQGSFSCQKEEKDQTPGTFSFFWPVSKS